MLGNVVDDLVERIAHGKARGGLGDGETRGLGGQRGRTAHARVHLDDNEAAGLGVHGKLHVGSAGLDANLLQNGERRDTHALVLKVTQGLRRATVMESPVCTPMGSRFSMEHTMMPLPAWSRMTSISYSFQPSMDSSTSTSWAGESSRP